MTKKLKLKAKIFGDKTLYEVTEIDMLNDISVYDKKTGCHMDFDWAMVEGFISENPKLIAQTKVKNFSSNPLLSDSLLSFFLWFRANGELYVDKPIEEMISIYQKESNVR